jgi:hypothetical protein
MLTSCVADCGDKQCDVRVVNLGNGVAEAYEGASGEAGGELEGAAFAALSTPMD